MGVLTQLLLLATLIAASYAQRGKSDDKRFINVETKLQSDLLTDYNKAVRPVARANNTLDVQLGLAAVSLVEVDEKKQTVTILGWLRKVWYDAALKWNPAEYDNIKVIRVPIDLIWRPDIVLYNSADQRYEFNLDAMAVVHHDGKVLWIPPVIFRALCPFDLTYFPNDHQNCTLKFGSWTYDGYKVNLIHYEGKNGIDFKEFSLHSEWDVEPTGGKITQRYYACCVEPYPDMSFYLTITRRGNYYNYMYTAPSILCGLLTPFVFLIPANQNQKFQLGVGLIVAVSILMVRLEAIMPAAVANLPILCKFYIADFILIFLSIIFACITTNLAHRGGKNKPPAFIKKFLIGGCGRLLCIRKENYTHGNVSMKDLEDKEGSGLQVSGHEGPSDWYIAALVLDRLLFIIFLAIVLVCAIVICA